MRVHCVPIAEMLIQQRTQHGQTEDGFQLLERSLCSLAGRTVSSPWKKASAWASLERSFHAETRDKRSVTDETTPE